MTTPPKDLVKLWDAKLKESGFDDIEDRNSPRQMLKSWHSTKFIHGIDPERMEAKRRYFELAEHFLNTNKFKSDKERAVWDLHAQGKSLREIETECPIEVSKDGASIIIKRLIREMKAR